MRIIEEIGRIAGSENVTDDPEILRSYSKDTSLSKPVMPNYVAKVKSAEEISAIVKLANQLRLPIIPCSSGVHFYGNTIPAEGGVILDLRGMNKILDINLRTRTVRIEPGVTWRQLQAELEKHGFMAMCPLLPHPMKSVLTSHLEREPMLIPKFEYGDAMVTLEAVLPDGAVFRTGSACVPGFPDTSAAEGVNPGGPGNITWSWFIQGAQGTMGVVTWVQVKIVPKPKINKTFFIPFERVEDAVTIVYEVQRRMLGEECLILNRVNMASILAKLPADFERLRNLLPPWLVILVLGGWRRPEEKIEYEEEGLKEATDALHLPEAQFILPGLPGLGKELPGMLRNAWSDERLYWKFARKGACQDLFFHTKLEKAGDFVELIKRVCGKHGYQADDIGLYLQPLEYARACHFESNFFYAKDEEEKIRRLFLESAQVVLDAGAFFARPYGAIAGLVYDRAMNYTAALRKVKNIIDPNNIMSPGRLCF